MEGVTRDSCARQDSNFRTFWYVYSNIPGDPNIGIYVQDVSAFEMIPAPPCSTEGTVGPNRAPK